MKILIGLALIIIVIIVLSKRRRKEKAKANVPGGLPQLLQEHVAYYQKLSQEDQQTFVAKAKDFLERTHIEGIGIEVEDIDKTLIAASAVIPIFGFKEWKYYNLTNVIMYPDTFDETYQYEGDRRNILGMVGSGHMNGQMILSRRALRDGFSASADKQNTAIHEFVHLLDKSDGAVDGIPQNLLEHSYTLPWIQLVHKEIARIEHGKSDINPYAAMNTGEFLAVASEYFFEKPSELAKKHPQLYEILSKVFNQDLAKEP